MNQTVHEMGFAVPPEEVQRRLADYRRLGLQQRAAAHMVYQDPHVVCPWPGCGLRIAGIIFRLEKMGDEADHARMLAAWWDGPGLVGRCPGCKNHVLFGLDGKRPVLDPQSWRATFLPENWHEIAHLVPPCRT